MQQYPIILMSGLQYHIVLITSSHARFATTKVAGGLAVWSFAAGKMVYNKDQITYNQGRYRTFLI